MYGTAGRGVGLATGLGGAGATLALTGFPVAGFLVLGVVAVVLGLALVRFAGVKRPEAGRMRTEKAHLESAGRD
jgi:hypothetical protein